jgi:hypothetical protein
MMLLLEIRSVCLTSGQTEHSIAVQDVVRYHPLEEEEFVSSYARRATTRWEELREYMKWTCTRHDNKRSLPPSRKIFIKNHTKDYRRFSSFRALAKIGPSNKPLRPKAIFIGAKQYPATETKNSM